MPTAYTYRLWDGKSFVGLIGVSYLLQGKFHCISEQSLLKQPYGSSKSILVPLLDIKTSDDGVRRVWETVLDVRHKSERQRKIIRSRGGNL